MLPKISQGVTTVMAGNCGISAAPVRLRGEPPDPMNLLGGAGLFRYPRFRDYVQAIGVARPAVNNPGAKRSSKRFRPAAANS